MNTSPTRKSFFALARKTLAVRGSFFPKKKLILVGVMHMPHHQIAFAHLVKALSVIRPSGVRAFSDPDNTRMNRQQVLLRKLRYLLASHTGSPTESTYRLMGATSLIYPYLQDSHSRRSQQVVEDFFRDNPSKSSLEDLRIGGVLVGDLIYDDYLKKVDGTLDMADPRFREHFFESIRLVFWWIDFFDQHEVSAVVCNSVYRLAIVGRIGLKYGCDVFDAQLGRIVRLRGDGNQFDDYREFREVFAGLEEKPKKLAEGQAAIDKKLQGEADSATFHIDAPGGVVSDQRVLGSSERRKILIAPHCFSDSAHSFGKMLFPDFHEWLRFLANIVKHSSDDWYLKPHPRGLTDLDVIKELFSECSNLVFLPHDASLGQIAKEGLALALTMRGHVAIDLPLMGVPVVTCTEGSRYRDYSFAINASSVDEYRALLSDLDWLPYTIDVDELREFYFMDNKFFHPNVLMPDFLGAGRKLKGESPQAIFDEFARQTGPEYVRETIRQLVLFVKSQKLRFRRI